MSKVLAWIRSILCFLCFFQVFLQLTPKESYRKYLKFTLVEETFRREIERQIREVPENLGYSVLSLSVSYGKTGEPEAIDLVLLSSKDEGTAKIQEELSRIYGLAGEEIRITVKEA